MESIKFFKTVTDAVVAPVLTFFRKFPVWFWITIVGTVSVITFSLLDWVSFSYLEYSAGFNLLNPWFRASDSIFSILLSISQQFLDSRPIMLVLMVVLLVSFALMIISIIRFKSNIGPLFAYCGFGLSALVTAVFMISMASFNQGLIGEGFDKSEMLAYPLIVFYLAFVSLVLVFAGTVQRSVRKKVEDNIAFIVMLLLFVTSIYLSDVFFTSQNIFNLLRQLTPPILLAMGMLFVVMTGGIDLSVGSVIAIGSVFTSQLLTRGYSLPITVLLVILVGAAFGAFNGYMVAGRRLAPFVVTLAGMTIARGIAFIVSRGMPERIGNATLVDFAVGSYLNIPYIVWFVALIIVILLLVQRFTVFGRFVQAIGSNETAVKLSGINTSLYKIGAYVLSSVLSVIGGIIVASRVAMGSPLAGEGFELDAIAAVVIGGASLAGGNGKVINTLMGALIIGMIGNIMNLQNVPAYTQKVLMGIIILIAVLLQSLARGSKDISSSSQV